MQKYVKNLFYNRIIPSLIRESRSFAVTLAFIQKVFIRFPKYFNQHL